MTVTTVVYDRSARRTLRRLPAHRKANIVAKIEQLAANPAALSANVNKLRGREGYRLRVGDYRVIFEIEGDILTVFAIGSRGSIY